MPRKKKVKSEFASLDLGLDKQEDFNLETDELDEKSKSDVKEVKEDIEVEEVMKKYKLKILNVEDNALIVDVMGWSKRIYFDLPFSQLEYLRANKNQFKGKLVDIAYFGDITKPFEVRILRLKNIDDIGNKF